MSVEAYLPCFKCGKTLQNVFIECDNQPWEGTEFRTYGHYGSTFWDSFNGEELVLNICDRCLNEHTNRLGQQKRFLPVKCQGMGGYGKKWVERPLVAYTGHEDDTTYPVSADSLGWDGERIEWAEDILEMREDLLK